MATNRQRAEKENLTTSEYFWYSDSKYLRHKFHFQLRDVMCKECTYIPRADSSDPMRAYKAHLKKEHRPTWEQAYGKPFVIREESDEEIATFLRELVHA